jgi:ATP-binding protein involved in chromosome partitioning
MARDLGVPFLGEIPLVRAVREAGDRGVPIVAAEPSHPVSRAYREIAERILLRVDEAARPRADEPARPAGLNVVR